MEYLLYENDKASIDDAIVEKKQGKTNYTKEYQNFTPLMLCATKPNNFDCFTALLRHGAKYDTLDSYGNTLLHIAAIYTNFKVIKYIIENLKIDIDALNHKGEKAIDKCSKKGFSEGYLFLLNLDKSKDS